MLKKSILIFFAVFIVSACDNETKEGTKENTKENNTETVQQELYDESGKRSPKSNTNAEPKGHSFVYELDGKKWEFDAVFRSISLHSGIITLKIPEPYELIRITDKRSHEYRRIYCIQGRGEIDWLNICIESINSDPVSAIEEVVDKPALLQENMEKHLVLQKKFDAVGILDQPDSIIYAFAFKLSTSQNESIVITSEVPKDAKDPFALKIVADIVDSVEYTAQ